MLSVIYYAATPGPDILVFSCVPLILNCAQSFSQVRLYFSVEALDLLVVASAQRQYSTVENNGSWKLGIEG